MEIKLLVGLRTTESIQIDIDPSKDMDDQIWNRLDMIYGDSLDWYEYVED